MPPAAARATAREDLPMSTTLASELLERIAESMRQSLESTGVQGRELVRWQDEQDDGKLRAHSLHETLARLGEHLDGWQTRIERVVADTRRAEELLAAEEVELKRFSALLAATRETLTADANPHANPGAG